MKLDDAPIQTGKSCFGGESRRRRRDAFPGFLPRAFNPNRITGLQNPLQKCVD